MIVLFGNQQPHELVENVLQGLPGPAVTTFAIDPTQLEDGTLTPGYIMGTDVVSILREMAQNPGPVKRNMGGNELLQDLIGLWEQHSNVAPAWISIVDAAPYDSALAEDCERCVAEYWGCDRGVPGDVEDTHYTQLGNDVFPPGVAPSSSEEQAELDASLDQPVEGV